VISSIRYKKKEKKTKTKKCNNKNTEIVRKAIKKQRMQARKLNHRTGLRKQEIKMKMMVFTCPNLLVILLTDGCAYYHLSNIRITIYPKV